MENGLILAFIGAGLSVILGGIGSILGMSTVSQASAGVATEKPETFGKVLVMSILPGSQGIYGFVGAFMILLSIGAIGGTLQNVDMTAGWQMLGASLPVTVTGLVSGIYQGRVATASLNMIAKDPTKSGQALVLSALVEAYAIFGLLISIFMILSIQFPNA